jgi:tetratricopeptide (TPR) repeat protein
MAEENLEKALDKANMLLAAGDYKKSFNAFKKVTNEYPKKAAGYFGMAEASLGIPKLKMQEIALYYEKACKLNEENALYWATYGNFCFENGILKKGEECFLKAAEVDEENSSLYLSDLATSYYHSANNFRNHYPNMTDEDISRSSLKYILMAFNLTKDKAKELIDGIEEK